MSSYYINMIILNLVSFLVMSFMWFLCYLEQNGRHFANDISNKHFLQLQLLYFDLNFTKVCSSESEWQSNNHMKLLQTNSLRFLARLSAISKQSTHYNDVKMGAMAAQITCVSIVYSTVCFRRRSKGTSKLRDTGLCERNSPVTGEFP